MLDESGARKSPRMTLSGWAHGALIIGVVLGASRAEAGGPEPVGLSLWWEDGAVRTEDGAPRTVTLYGEAPRFVRGFHDILITIGVIAAMSGLAALGGIWVQIPAIIVLAEILIVRQRLALPAFVLTILFSLTVFGLVLPIMDEPGNNKVVAGLILFVAQPLALIPYYWRYRVPVALALIIIAGFGLAFMALLGVLQAILGTDAIFETHDMLVRVLALAMALLLFGAAMTFDLRDPRRVTRRSDVAFWLHLGAAPLLLWSVFAVVLGPGTTWRTVDTGPADAATALAVVAVMMLIGIVIDRRAFVTSGLISLGVAIFVLARAAALEFSELGAASILLVGIIVLVLGTGWLALRRRILALLPQSWRDRLPPVVG